jgi:NAD(P)-dependent dehydrogenase (short-subunit alcohol dehydrogenase family)
MRNLYIQPNTGDYDKDAGNALAKKLGSNVTYIPCDVSKYSDNVKLFKTALEKYGHIDHAIANAGIGERGDWFNPSLTIEDVEQVPATTTLNINLIGVLYFVRIALPYLKHNRNAGDDRSISLLSSAAGFRESPGLPIYQSTKHGVQGVMRSLRKILWERDGIRINVLCPGMTESNMTVGISEIFRERNQPVNVPDDLAKALLGYCTEKGMYGKAIYVEGARYWEIEEGIVKTMPQWLGEEPTKRSVDPQLCISALLMSCRLWESLAVVGGGNTWDFMRTQKDKNTV